MEPYLFVDTGNFAVLNYYLRLLWREDSIMRVAVTMACTQCKQRNYMITKDKRKHPEKMELKKYCRFCNTHTLHKETK